MNAVAVISASGKKLMPTTAYRARRLLKHRKATVYAYHPVFTIQLTEREDGDTQPIEYKCDTGYQHIGISICSAAKEYVNEQRDLLKDETERHNDSRKYRKARRNRKTRHRKARWSNRKSVISEGGFAPSIRNKRDVHVRLYEDYCKVFPITGSVFEMGQFDTQVLKALAEGNPLPEGTDYQQGEQYGYATLREAVFARDGYKCICCGKSAIRDSAILRIHHLGFRIGDRSNRMSNLASVCTKCHTSKNHKSGGKLYGLKPALKTFKGATFMTMVRYSMLQMIRDTDPGVDVHMTYGAATKLARRALSVKKSHSNDAYCMGMFHPKHRTDFRHYRKRRRNNRILSKFYDATYIDLRDGSKKKGAQLSCGRTNRSMPRNNPLNERGFRARKVTKGHVSVRRQHYALRPGDTVFVEGRKRVVKGVISNGKAVLLIDGKTVSVRKIEKAVHTGGWAKAT